MHASVWVCRHAGHGGSSSSRRGDKYHQYFYRNVWMLIDVLTAYLVERQKCLRKLWSNYTIKSDFYKISIGVISHALRLLCICAVTPELFRKYWSYFCTSSAQAGWVWGTGWLPVGTAPDSTDTTGPGPPSTDILVRHTDTLDNQSCSLISAPMRSLGGVAGPGQVVEINK